MYLGDVIHKPFDFELEDIIEPSLYHNAVQQAYPDQPVEQPQQADGKRTKRYEVAFRQTYDIGFNKRRVAETLKPILVESGSETQGLGELQAVVNNIWEMLQAQVKPRAEVAKAAESAH